MQHAQTVSVSIHCSADETYRFLADPENFSQWSLFVRVTERDGDDWIAQTPTGSVRIRFVPKNEFRVLDHWVNVSPDLQVYVPMRVLANPAGGSEVIFTVFPTPGMTEEGFAEDVRMVLTDLNRLKARLETGSVPEN